MVVNVLVNKRKVYIFNSIFPDHVMDVFLFFYFFILFFLIFFFLGGGNNPNLITVFL